MPSLVVIFGRDRGRHFDLPRGEKIVLGRGSHLNNRLLDPSISRKHLEVVHLAHNSKCMVLDLESRNGARINDKRLFHSRELSDGDVIQIGYTLLVFVRITFEAETDVKTFLEDCEQRYETYLQRLRDHAARHADKDDHGYGSAGSMSGTLHLGNLFGKLKGQ